MFSIVLDKNLLSSRAFETPCIHHSDMCRFVLFIKCKERNVNHYESQVVILSHLCFIE